MHHALVHWACVWGVFYEETAHVCFHAASRWVQGAVLIFIFCVVLQLKKKDKKKTKQRMYEVGELLTLNFFCKLLQNDSPAVKDCHWYTSLFQSCVVSKGGATFISWRQQEAPRFASSLNTIKVKKWPAASFSKDWLLAVAVLCMRSTVCTSHTSDCKWPEWALYCNYNMNTVNIHPCDFFFLLVNNSHCYLRRYSRIRAGNFTDRSFLYCNINIYIFYLAEGCMMLPR